MGNYNLPPLERGLGSPRYVHFVVPFLAFLPFLCIWGNVSMLIKSLSLSFTTNYSIVYISYCSLYISSKISKKLPVNVLFSFQCWHATSHLVNHSCFLLLRNGWLRNSLSSFPAQRYFLLSFHRPFVMWICWKLD